MRVVLTVIDQLVSLLFCGLTEVWRLVAETPLQLSVLDFLLVVQVWLDGYCDVIFSFTWLCGWADFLLGSWWSVKRCHLIFFERLCFLELRRPAFLQILKRLLSSFWSVRVHPCQRLCCLSEVCSPIRRWYQPDLWMYQDTRIVQVSIRLAFSRLIILTSSDWITPSCMQIRQGNCTLLKLVYTKIVQLAPSRLTRHRRLHTRILLSLIRR